MIDKIIGKIKNAQQQAALEAVSRPPSEGKDVAYLYGQRVGYYAGLEHALRLIEQTLSDQDRHDDRL